jgi:hypothetical protein
MAIQIGKYKRPGIFIEEFDNSIIATPTLEGITNLVVGVSKKGPVNTPILLNTLNDLDAVFGQLDRSLERKGSFFHRTVAKMLESTPVFAMNLLVTDDSLDVIEYKSISTSADYNNDILREGPYRRFFDTTGFWKRDTESFINLTKSNTGYTERAFSFTNLSDKTISVFVFKSSLTGFDRTLLEWYGTLDKMPPYVNSSDWASDYMVDVVVVGGDWSNYQELAVDPRWSAYFNSSGLRKEQIRNFANDRNVQLLSYYEGLSLIPYFRDANGRNIFIETSINRDTDRTGLFCAFNSELVESDFYNGMMDLLGNTIVDKEETDIEFLSYRETIAESIEIVSTPLDLPGNVSGVVTGSFSWVGQDPHAFSKAVDGIGPNSSGNGAVTSGIVYETERTAWFSEGSVYNVKRASTITSSTSSITVTYQVASGAYTIIGNNYVPVTSTASLTISASDYPVSSTTFSYVSTFVLDSTGVISVVSTTEPATNPSVTTSDIVLGSIEFTVNTSGQFVLNGSDYYNTMNNITVGTSSGSNGFIELTFGAANQINISTQSTAGSIKVEFPGTNVAADLKNYSQYRQFKMFNKLVSILDSPNKNKVVMNLGPSAGNYKKYSLETATITNIVNSTTQNKSFVINTTLTNAELADVLQGYFVLYTEDNELVLGSEEIVTKSEQATATQGVVAKYSKFYTRYYDGIINNRDYFYANRLWTNSSNSNSSLINKSVSVTFLDGETYVGTTSSYAGYDYIVFEFDSVGATAAATAMDIQTFEQLSFPTSQLNKGSFTIAGNSVNPTQTPSQLATALGMVGGNYFAYQVNEEVEFEMLNDVTHVDNRLLKHYLKMYLEGDGDLLVEFLDELLESDADINIQTNYKFMVQSQKANLKQSLEIEIPTNYVQIPNKVLVKGDRYTEVKIGDFLEAYVDESTLLPGQKGRKLTRVLSKRQYSGDTTLTEITCDARIKRYNFSGDYQTMRYTSIDNYVTTYKAITMDGFRIRQASLPDGTETKQNQVLNLLAKGTPLFKALTNKDAIDFRYLIDSFGLGLTERSKQQLVDICGERLDAFGFINMPSLRAFKNSSSPSFVNSEGVLQLEYVAKGGDPESNPAFLYSFGEGKGNTCVGYFTPYVTVNDNGRPLEFPPASFVATTYMRKHLAAGSSTTPWTIAAGINNGRITNITGTEGDFTQTDIEFMNQAQMNPIVFKRNRGYVIETENTAQTLYRSALSYIHVREVLIELERELADMLLEYQWKFNTPDVRSEIKLRADNICESYVTRNGLFNYFNKMDEENNTPEIIDNQIGVLDTYVEPIKGMGIIVNNITILRTGAIEAGGFL